MRSHQRPVFISRAVAEFSVLLAFSRRFSRPRELSIHVARFAVSTDQFARAASAAFPAVELLAPGAPGWRRFLSQRLTSAAPRELPSASCASSQSDNQA